MLSTYIIFRILFIPCCVMIFPVLNALVTNTSDKNASRAYMWAAFYLKDLEQLELEFVKNLTKFKTEDAHVALEIESYLREFVLGSGLNSLEDVNNIPETQVWKNPVCGYRLIDRTSGILKSLIFNKSFNESFDTAPIGSYFEKYGWPSSSDIKDSAIAIIRIQHVYDLKAESLSSGWISSTKTRCSFNSRHCLEIAKIAGKTKYLALAIDWLEVAKAKVVSDKEVDPDSIHEALWKAIEKHNEAERRGIDERLFSRSISHAPGNSKTAPKVRDQVEKSNPKKTYWSLCSGENRQTEEIKAKLFCWLESKIHPFLTLSPTKMEFLSINPDVVQMYDVLTVPQMVRLTSEWFNSDKLITNVTSKAEGGYYDSPSHRTSSYMHISDDNIDSIALKRKIEVLTGLPLHPNMCTIIIPVQITSYSFGGHYAPHEDKINWTAADHEEVLATFSIYLNDIEMGGATAFENLGFAVQPIPGSAVLWLSGYKNLKMRHGGCPVVLGEKWLATKWISTRDKSRVPKWNSNPRKNNKRRKQYV